MNKSEKQERRTMQLAIGLVLFVALIYAMTFSKLPVWLPALQ